jgi:hypothetical protein
MHKSYENVKNKYILNTKKARKSYSEMSLDGRESLKRNLGMHYAIIRYDPQLTGLRLSAQSCAAL